MVTAGVPVVLQNQLGSYVWTDNAESIYETRDEISHHFKW